MAEAERVQLTLDDDLSALIGRIYESARDPPAWDRVMEMLKARMGACCVLFSTADFTHSELSRTQFFGNDSQAFIDGTRRYAERLYHHDPSFDFAVRHPLARFCHTADIIPRAHYLDHPFIHWNRTVIGSTHWLVGYTPPSDDFTFGVSIHPPAEQGPVRDADIRLFRVLFDHMDRALRLAARPPFLADPDRAQLLIDRHGRVTAASDAAAQILARGDGLDLRSKRLTAHHHGDHRRLRAMIEQAALPILEGKDRHGGQGGAVAVTRPSGLPDWLVVATPLPPMQALQGCRSAAVLVRIVDPSGPLPETIVRRWETLFGLTPAETRLAVSLVRHGDGPREAAARLHIAYATARVQLASLFRKTGTHSQAQLVLLLSRLR